MDPAQELEQTMLARQESMIAAIAQGGSPVQQFYGGTTVFITGGSGFLGKQLLEKLLRSCDIKRVYMLLRQKKGATIQERLASILQDVVYDSLREKQPHFADKIVPVEGDVEELRLGLSDKDWSTLTDEVNVIFHVAATVRFTEPIKKAILINVRGTREALALGKHCKNLKCFNHTSTAFAHATVPRINSDVCEQFYRSPVPPHLAIDFVETVHEARLDAITPSLIEGWPNTYTFTKALAEELIRTSAGDIPVCIVKPPVVVSSYIEPVPGWIDLKTCFASPIGCLLAVGLGLVHLFFAKSNNTVSYAPVDYVNNAIIAASWDTVEQKKRGHSDIPVYTVSTSGHNTKFRLFSDILKSDDGYKMATPRAVWYNYALVTSNKVMYWMLTWFLHYIPGYLIDGLVDMLRVRPKGIPRLVDVYSRVYKLSLVYQYFYFNFWNIRDDNLRGMIERMSEQDRGIYNCDVTTIDFKEQILVWCIGVRKYIIKDGLKGSVKAYYRQKYFFSILNLIFLVTYGYLIYIVMYLIYYVFTNIVQLSFY